MANVKMTLTAVLVMVVVALAGSPCFAGILWSDNFDYTSGTLESHGWVLTTVPNGYNLSGTQGLDTSQYVSSPQSLTQTTTKWADWSNVTATHAFSSITKGSASVDVRSNHATATPARFKIDSSTGMIAYVTFSSAGISINGQWIRGMTANMWFNFDLSWNDATGLVTWDCPWAYHDASNDYRTGSVAYQDAAAAGADAFEAVNHAAYDYGNSVAPQAWYDNVVIIPEPATLVLLVAGGAIGLIRRRKR